MTRCDLRVRIRALAIPAMVIVLVGGTVGCAPAGEQETDQEQAADGAGGGAEVSPDVTTGSGSPDEWVQGVTVGSRVDTQGAIPPEAEGNSFRVGQPVYVAVELAEAAPPASVHVVFYDASGQAVAEDAKKVPARGGHLYFDSGDTSDWATGAARVSISIDGEEVAQESFTLGAAASEPTGTEP